MLQFTMAISTHGDQYIQQYIHIDAIIWARTPKIVYIPHRFKSHKNRAVSERVVDE